MTRRILKAGAWILASILALGAAAYGIAVASNWRDQEPSADAIRLAAAYRNRPALADSDNAFIDLKRYRVAAGEDALQRYQTFIAHAGWQESVPTDFSEPLPPYFPVMEGQRLLLANARMLAEKGDHAAVKKLLGDDLRFWRKVLESSDILISKMIATAALNRHFESGNLVLKEFAHANVALAIPAEWDEPITDSERSFRNVLRGEWIYGAGVIRQMDSDRLFQPQASMNELATYYSRVAELLDAPVTSYQTALDRARSISEQRQREALRSLSPYNIGNRLIIAQGSTDFASYAARVNDIEGVRLAALAAVRFRERNVPASDVAAALETAPFRSPYDDRPFFWDDERGEIVFVGLQSGPQGLHRIEY